MLKHIGLYGFSFFLSCSVSHAMLLVDMPEDGESQNAIICCLKKNTFPNISVTDRETITDLTNHFSTFSEETLLQTPESTFFTNKLKEQEGIDSPVIHIPSIIYDLEIIYHFFTNDDFARTTTDNTDRGVKNCVGIKDTAVADGQFISLSKKLFPIFNNYTTNADFITHAKERIQSILSIEHSSEQSKLDPTQGLLSLQDSQDLIIATLVHELQSQREGKINFYRTSKGKVYDVDQKSDEITLLDHPKGAIRFADDLELLKDFFCGTDVNSMQGVCNKKYPPLPVESTLGQILAFEQTYENTNWWWGPEIKKAAKNVENKAEVVDCPFTLNTMEPQELSYSYSFLAGFIFDGVVAQQSACSFVYTARNKDKYPYFYALNYKLPDFYAQYAPCFTTPQTPFYQGVLDSGELFHPRFKLISKGDVQTDLADFYGNIKVLGLFSEDANTEQNKPFVQALENRHRKLVESQ